MTCSFPISCKFHNTTSLLSETIESICTELDRSQKKIWVSSRKMIWSLCRETICHWSRHQTMILRTICVENRTICGFLDSTQKTAFYIEYWTVLWELHRKLSSFLRWVSPLIECSMLFRGSTVRNRSICLDRIKSRKWRFTEEPVSQINKQTISEIILEAIFKCLALCQLLKIEVLPSVLTTSRIIITLKFILLQLFLNKLRWSMRNFNSWTMDL